LPFASNSAHHLQRLSPGRRFLAVDAAPRGLPVLFHTAHHHPAAALSQSELASLRRHLTPERGPEIAGDTRAGVSFAGGAWPARSPGATPVPARRSLHLLKTALATVLGFIFEIGGSFQAAIVGVTLAVCALEKPDSDLGAKYVEFYKSGNALSPMRRNSLYFDPDACVTLPRAPRRVSRRQTRATGRTLRATKGAA
jgi:hypothetical protein